MVVMSDAAAREPAVPRRPRRKMRDVLKSIADRQRENDLPELSEDDAEALAVEETRAVRRELNERGVL
jgi:hypothetical protein